jgi:hypothetical protein
MLQGGNLNPSLDIKIVEDKLKIEPKWVKIAMPLIEGMQFNSPMSRNETFGEVESARINGN